MPVQHVDNTAMPDLRQGCWERKPVSGGHSHKTKGQGKGTEQSIAPHQLRVSAWFRFPELQAKG